MKKLGLLIINVISCIATISATIISVFLILTMLAGAKCSESKYSGNGIPHSDPVAWCANVSEYAAAGRCVDTSGYNYEKTTPPIQNLWNKAGGRL